MGGGETTTYTIATKMIVQSICYWSFRIAFKIGRIPRIVDGIVQSKQLVVATSLAMCHFAAVAIGTGSRDLRLSLRKKRLVECFEQKVGSHGRITQQEKSSSDYYCLGVVVVVMTIQRADQGGEQVITVLIISIQG